ncbi:ABC transporter ATP-binding protein [soil metagenome]
MISCKDLTKSFDTGVKALDKVTFEINKGEICGYIGTNGAGKSTTVKIMTGILQPDSGTVLIGGIDAVKEPMEVKKITGYVPENANIFNSLTVTEFLNFIGKVRDLDGSIIKKRIEKFSAYFGFEQFLNESIGILSKGNKQKILITSALIHDPRVLFFDEPLNGLDANAIFDFQDIVSMLAAEGKTILYCSHLLDTIEKISTKVIIIDKGKIVLDKRTGELKDLENYKNLEQFFRQLEPENEKKKVQYTDIFG